jgi:hypothetical protein
MKPPDNPDDEDWEGFPESEEEIVELAERVIRMIKENPEAFRDAPFSAAELRESIDRFWAADAREGVAEEQARASFAAMEQSLTEVMKALQNPPRSVEITVRGEMERLSHLGWGGRPDATEWELPGLIRSFQVEVRAQRHLDLAWLPPAEGGPAAAYSVQRRMPGGDWEEVAVAVGNEGRLYDLPRGIEMDIRVVPVNRAGGGEPSNTVTVVL